MCTKTANWWTPEANENAKIVRLKVANWRQKVNKNEEIVYTKTGPKIQKLVRLIPRARGG